MFDEPPAGAYLPTPLERAGAIGLAVLLLAFTAFAAHHNAPSVAVLGDSRVQLMNVRYIAFNARNYGENGNDLADLRRRAAGLPLAKARVVVLAGGLNDWHTVRLQGFGPRYAALLADMPQKPVVAVAMLPANPAMTLARTHNVKNFNGSTPLFAEDNEKIRQLCAARPRCTFVAVPEAMLTDKGELRPEMTTDGVHLTPLGYRVWTAAIRRGLASAAASRAG